MPFPQGLYFPKNRGWVFAVPAGALFFSKTGARTAKCSIFDGRVVKSRGPRNTLPPLPPPAEAGGSEPKPLSQSHPSTRARGQDDGSYTNTLK